MKTKLSEREFQAVVLESGRLHPVTLSHPVSTSTQCHARQLHDVKNSWLVRRYMHTVSLSLVSG